MQLLIAFISCLTVFTSCNKDETNMEEEETLPTPSIEWQASYGGGVFDNFTSSTPTGGLLPVQFGITAVDATDANPAMTITVMEEAVPQEGKTYALDALTNFMVYANTSFDNEDSYSSISGNLNVERYEEIYSASGITYYAMDGSFEAVLQDDDSPVTIIEIQGNFTNVLFADQ
jgi:hypothetical protein